MLKYLKDKISNFANTVKNYVLSYAKDWVEGVQIMDKAFSDPSKFIKTCQKNYKIYQATNKAEEMIFSNPTGMYKKDKNHGKGSIPEQLRNAGFKIS